MAFLDFGTSVPTATRHPKEGSCAPPPATNTRDNRYQGLDFFPGVFQVKAAVAVAPAQRGLSSWKEGICVHVVRYTWNWEHAQ